MGAQADAVVASIEALVATAAKALVLEIVANLVRATPVRTGWARANWIPSISEPAVEAVGSPSSVSNDGQQEGIQQVLRFKLADATLWIANNVPYISMLNNGSSTQAPAGFVERAIDEALHEMEQRYAGSVDISDARKGFEQDVGARGASGLASAFAPEGLPFS